MRKNTAGADAITSVKSKTIITREMSGGTRKRPPRATVQLRVAMAQLPFGRQDLAFPMDAAAWLAAIPWSGVAPPCHLAIMTVLHRRFWPLNRAASADGELGPAEG
jgi:hypothetical protein